VVVVSENKPLGHPRALFTSESVTEGHPDKVCDQVSDAILDAFLTLDPEARVAVETLATAGRLIVAGEATSNSLVEVREIARAVIRDIGYTRSAYGFDYLNNAIQVWLHPQSGEINACVTKATDSEPGAAPSTPEEDEGAGDQGMMIGYACDETPELMPLPIMLAHHLARQLAAVRKDGTLSYLRPDGKTQVTVDYASDQTPRVDTVVIAAQHDPEVCEVDVTRDIEEKVVKPVFQEARVGAPARVRVNTSGRFTFGGPAADTGLTGRKIISDTYGGMARHGGGSFSGKDPTKVDRSGAYAARYVAKNVVAAGLARKFEVQVAYAIGEKRPVSIFADTFGTAAPGVSEDLIRRLIVEHFDLNPGGIVRTLDLKRPIYRNLSVYGHFGRSPEEAPWERVDKLEILRRAAGLER
jgi:S-adenosylmethionine synthetase